LFAKVWLEEIPSDWAAASVLLLAKSSKLADPADFRPIALTNTVGKIFFGVLSKRLENFHVLKTSSFQKSRKDLNPIHQVGLEHSFAMFEALLDAKFHQRQIVVSWLDLKNAYGSVRHNLIQFALSWYGVPSCVLQSFLIPTDKICARSRRKPGRQISFILMLDFSRVVVFRALSSTVFSSFFLISCSPQENGYEFKDKAIVLHDQAFADDISITTSTPMLNQLYETSGRSPPIVS
jgi:hypothetical protein